MAKGKSLLDEEKDKKGQLAWKAFLKAYSETGDVRESLKIVGVSHQKITHLKRLVPEFAESFADLQEMWTDRLESSLFQRATQGIERLKFDRLGQAVQDPRTKETYVEREYSDVAAIFLLKGLKPEKYRDRFEHTGKNGGPMETKISNLAELIKLATSPAPPDPKKAEPGKKA